VILSDVLLKSLATMADGDRTSYAPVVVDTGTDYRGY
jgi:hypothetical protein